MRPLRPAVLAGAVVVLAFGLLAPMAPVQAEPVYPSNDKVAEAKSKADRTRLAVNKLADAIVAADDQMAALRTKAEKAAEAYNAAKVKLDEAKASASSAERAAAAAQKELAASREQLGRFAAASYRSGGDIANAGALLTADGPGTLMDRANTIRQLGSQREYVLKRVESAQVVADLLNQQAQGALTTVRDATDQVRDAQRAAQGAVDEQSASLDRLNREKADLRDQLSRLDADATRLAEQRAAGLRAEAARRAAATAKAAGTKIPANSPSGTSVGTAAGGAKAVEFAKKQLGKWYLWGGNGPDRFDCSGLTQNAWREAGVNIPRVASWQYAAAQKISTSQLRPGDLVFYADDKSNWQTIHHVGIYVGNGQMIEAPHTGAQVRYASIWRSDLIGAARP